MILSDYYLLEKLPLSKSKMRYDVTESTGGYQSFETLKNKAGQLFFYYGDVPDRFNARVKRRADKCISKTHNISSVFVPDVTLPFAYGDVNFSSDAILLVFKDDYRVIELYVARGQKNNQRNIYNLLCDGELNNEIQLLKEHAQKLPIE